jgi:predicted alpha/beta hydrolase
MGKYLFFLVLLYAADAAGQTGDLSVDKTLNAFSKYYAGDATDSIYGLFNDRMKHAVTEENWRQTFPQLKSKVGAIGKFTPNGNGWGYANFIAAGTVDSMNLLLSLDSTSRIQGLFIRPGKQTGPAYHTNYKVNTDEGELAGELLVPPHAVRKIPVALIIAGSGPTDRNGNNVMGVKAQPYKLLAEALAKNGIASLRYDKRRVGESIGFKKSLDSLRFEDLVGDAEACIKKLKADTSFSTVTVIGHSEGALIGIIAAREEKADGFISLAGVGEDAAAVLKRQLMASLNPQSMSAVTGWLDSLHKGYRVTVPANSPVSSLFLPSTQTYMTSWFQYDPAREIAKLKMPVMIIQGLTDLQVTRQDAEKLKAAAPKASLVLIDSMNHVLKDAPADREMNMATYLNAELALDKELVGTVVKFISGLPASR